MQDQIRLLVNLQRLDAQILRIVREQAAKPVLIDRLKQEFNVKQQTLRALENGLKDIQLKHKNKEMDLNAKEENIRKMQVQLYQIKTNKEYTVMLKEIESAKADCSVLEEDIIRLLDVIDEQKKKIADERARLAQEESYMKQEIAKAEAELKNLDAQLKELEEKRPAGLAGIKAELLARYERLLHNKEDGMAIVPVAGESCGGCNTVLPPQVVNEVMKKDKIITCERCARMLYIKE